MASENHTITHHNLELVVRVDEADENRSDDLRGGLANLGISDPTVGFEKLASDMQQRCRVLLEELEHFHSYLRQQRRENRVEMRSFKNGLQGEMNLIDKLATADPNLPKTTHGLRSSNLAFYAAVWSIAKTCTSLTALGKRFYWLPERHAPYVKEKEATTGPRHQTYSTVVDIVSQDGLEWIKVSSITEKRIIWDLARAGWVGESSSEGSEDLEEDDPQGLLKQIEAIVKASRGTRVRYQHPKIRLVLPKIKAQPDAKEVANVLRKIRNLGVTVQTADHIPSEFPAVAEVLDRLAADRFESFSETLNVDCTILLAFVSDLSHGRVEAQDWHLKAISRQIEMESEDQVLPNSLWPACGARKLVCTREAAVRMKEIVDTIGTETEKKRASLMLDLDNGSLLPRKQLLKEFQKLSDYTIPLDWNLPIEVANIDIASIRSNLPPVAKKVSEILTTINQSVFLFGWSTGRTTVSSNRTVAKEIEVVIEEAIASSQGLHGQTVYTDTRGPDIWLSPTSRSLVGKEKQQRAPN